MDSSDPTLRPAPLPEDEPGRALRPQALTDFVGQAEARANLRVFIESARMRGKAMDHTLFHGPPGLGKTTINSGAATGNNLITAKSLLGGSISMGDSNDTVTVSGTITGTAINLGGGTNRLNGVTV